MLFTPDGPLKGADAIRPLFQAMFAEFGKPGAAFTMKQQFVDGDFAYILWTADTADNVYEVGTDTFVVRDGKIVAQSFAGKITPKGLERGVIPGGHPTCRSIRWALCLASGSVGRPRSTPALDDKGGDYG